MGALEETATEGGSRADKNALVVNSNVAGAIFTLPKSR